VTAQGPLRAVRQLKRWQQSMTVSRLRMGYQYIEVMPLPAETPT
jgi:hypothetical protein